MVLTMDEQMLGSLLIDGDLKILVHTYEDTRGLSFLMVGRFEQVCWYRVTSCLKSAICPTL